MIYLTSFYESRKLPLEVKRFSAAVEHLGKCLQVSIL